MEARQVKTRHLVEAVHGVPGSFNGLEKSGTLTRAQAQEAAMTAIKTLRYDEKEYFWINDRHPTMVMHPYKPETGRHGSVEIQGSVRHASVHCLRR